MPMGAAVWAGLVGDRKSKEEQDRDDVSGAFLKLFDYLDKNEDGLVGVESLAAYLRDCGVDINEDNLMEMEGFANEERMLTKNGIQHYAVKCSLYETYVDKNKDLTKEITKAEALWRMMDKNEDGEITRTEYGETLSKLSDRQVKFLFTKYDKDSTGRISKEEFFQMMEEWKNKKKNKD